MEALRISRGEGGGSEFVMVDVVIGSGLESGGRVVVVPMT